MLSPTEQATQAAVTIEKAHGLLKRKGWTQHTMKDPYTGSICLLQALCEANGPGEAEAKRIILRCLGTQTIPEWNDQNCRKLDEVYIALRAAKNIATELAEA